MAETINVDANSSVDFNNIQAAINAAFDGDTVLVADGTYTGPGNRDIDFLGKAITVRSENGPNNCIIDCAGAGIGFYFHNKEDSNSVLEGFTITNGLGAPGGGIMCNGSSPTISNCIISGNFSITGGGGISCAFSSSPIITNCTISDNTSGDGGGIWCWDKSNPTITNCTISGNSTRGKWGWGGGICLAGKSNPTVTNSTITNNWGGMGGGIYNSRGNPTFTNCTFIGNSTEDSGGAIYCRKSSLTVTNCTITGNKAEYAGGGICCEWDSIPTITNCVFTGNSATWGGGIISCGGLTITNCTFSGNSAYHGGAISGQSGDITNCIFWDDTADEIHGCWVYWRPGDGGPPWLNVTFSNVQGGWEGEGNIDADPYFVEPGYWADANDPNIIIEPNDPNAIWIEGNYYLLPTSPCIDAGDPNYIPEPNETDLDGNPRVSGDAIDMGAYETNYIQAEMKFTPQMLNCNSKGKYVKAHFVLPEGFLPEDVDVNEPAVAEPMGIESEYIKVLGSGKNLVKLEICFDREAFCAQITETGEVEITVIGSLTTSRYFYATDTIRIKP